MGNSFACTSGKTKNNRSTSESQQYSSSQYCSLNKLESLKRKDTLMKSRDKLPEACSQRVKLILTKEEAGVLLAMLTDTGFYGGGDLISSRNTRSYGFDCCGYTRHGHGWRPSLKCIVEEDET